MMPILKRLKEIDRELNSFEVMDHESAERYYSLSEEARYLIDLTNKYIVKEGKHENQNV